MHFKIYPSFYFVYNLERCVFGRFNVHGAISSFIYLLFPPHLYFHSYFPRSHPKNTLPHPQGPQVLQNIYTWVCITEIAQGPDKIRNILACKRPFTGINRTETRLF